MNVALPEIVILGFKETAAISIIAVWHGFGL